MKSYKKKIIPKRFRVSKKKGGKFLRTKNKKNRNRISNRISKMKKKRNVRRKTRLKGGFVNLRSIFSKINSKIISVANRIAPRNKNSQELNMFDTINSHLGLN